MRLRLLDTGASPAAFNMALDEAVLEGVAMGTSPPSLRTYAWSPPAISVGYFQGMREEIDIEACARLGIEAVRRVTGGGAVFHDAEITYSLVVPEGHELAPPDIIESYRIICAGLIDALAGLGVEARFVPINDIVSGGKKISGNAQTRKQGVLLQHGTLLLDVDVERMFAILRVPQEKLKGKLIEDVKARVTGLRSILGRPLGYEEAASMLKAGFAKAWGAAFEPGSPSPAELERAAVLAARKYGTEEWKFRR
jgi:lipoate-protein ligase A